MQHISKMSLYQEYMMFLQCLQSQELSKYEEYSQLIR